MLAFALIGGGGQLAVADGPREMAEMPRCEADVKLVAPSDWRCEADGGCTTCVNITDHDSDLLVRCLGEGATDRRALPTRFQFSVCHGGARQPV